ncbi:hypothetical protein CFC21_043930 [Triticum aestivum]|uniref:DUF1618 domain-containing protein n=2 Tax=Triticum aestivum TaxID=4565 RepID=A0A9R1FPL9_WHEAT|nr:uncharacterized protein LOC123072259 [Triticum aestivum]KAF7032793.1 hypothetical protein CFC21_043930 [Triticum aestivum]CDM86121.1 unnamed protein product [Triticum aestivum]
MAPSAGDAAAVPRYPAWVLLEKEGYDDDRDDATSASCKTTAGRDVKLGFYLVPPPEISYFHVHLSKLEGEDEDDFDFTPLFLFSAKGLVLFRILFVTGSDGSNLVEYFIYKAGRGGGPSLEPIPPTPLGSSSDSVSVSIVPCPDGDDGEDSYVLADLSVGSEIGLYDLHIYSSKTREWNTTPLQLPASPAVRTNDDLPCQFHKAIGLAADEVGWVDLWRGIVTCKVLDKDPLLRLIPLPKPHVDILQGEPGLIRDVTYCNGLFEFVEMQLFCRPVNVVSSIIHDSRPLLGLVVDEGITVPDGWVIRTCCRVDPSDFRFRAYTVHVDDFAVDSTISFPQMWDACAHDKESTFRNLTTHCPTFGVPGDRLVYLLSKVKMDDDNTWIVGVDLAKKMVKLIQPCDDLGYACIRPAFVPSTFSYYLNTNAGNFSPTLINHSEKTANNAKVDGDGDSCVREINIHHDQRSWVGDETSAPSGAWNSGENNLTLNHESADVQRTRLLQDLDSILFASGSGYIPMKQELETDADGNSWLSLPLEDLLSLLPQLGPDIASLTRILSWHDDCCCW